MTVKSLELLNFESHKFSSLEFPQGVTIITGLSGHGKSGIVRGFNWALHNKPDGEAMLSYTSSGDTLSYVEFHDEGWVTRTRGNGINEYSISSDEDSFKALRGNVPNGVSTISNMDEINVQKQKDFYFMLMDSPGQVAKMFNKVSGLEEMDSALDTINSMYREQKKKFDSLSYRSEDLNERLEAVSWIKKADISFQEIENRTEETEAVENEIGSLEDIVSSIASTQKEIDLCKDTSAIPKIDAIFDKEDECNALEDEIDVLTKLVEGVLQHEKELKYIRLPEKGRIERIEAVIRSRDDIRDEIARTNLLIQNIAIYKSDIANADAEINIMKHKHSELLVENGKCPTCGRRV